MKPMLLVRSLAVAAMLAAAWQLGSGMPSVSAEVHTGNLHDCEDFASQSSAQAHLNQNPSDPDNLDSDDDGIACENYDYSGGYYYYGSPYTDGGVALAASVSAITPSYLSLVVSPATIPCNGQAGVTARLVYPNGTGASSQLIQFGSTSGTVFTNIMTDASGYVTTTFVAPYNSGDVTITASFGGIHRTATVKVDCPRKPDQPIVYNNNFKPPATGDAGLAAASNETATYWYLAGVLLVMSTAGVGALAYARQRE